MPNFRPIGAFPMDLIHFPSKFVFKFFADFCRVSKKITFFWPKIGQFSTEISDILEINKNHLNTPNSQVLGHLKHFLPKNGHFRPFLSLLIYIGICQPDVIPPLTLSAITFDLKTLAQKVIPFWKALEIGYLIQGGGKKR